MIPEAAMLRKELHAVHEKLDGNPDVNECLLASMESPCPEAAEAKV